MHNIFAYMQWHALDRSEQAKYYEMAREERARHMQVNVLVKIYDVSVHVYIITTCTSGQARCAKCL